MKIAIVTDAWRPQVNGVVTTLTHTVETLGQLGHEVVVFSPNGLPTVQCPSYPEIRLALFQGRRLAAWLQQQQPDALHIATEGPLGLAARQAAVRFRLSFTTAYHTQFPQYLRARYPVPEWLSYGALRWFHALAARTMVGTRQVRRELRARGFRHLCHWTRGVDTALFRPRPEVKLPYPGPIMVYAGRVAVEKGVEDFCQAEVSGTKVVIGGGPALADLQRRYPSVVFSGFQFGLNLAELLAGADCFVFPSRTDTFGLVMLEAMASGLPVAAYPVTGPRDLIREGETGCLRANLADAIVGALRLNSSACRTQALEYRWEFATRQFVNNLVDARTTRRARHRTHFKGSTVTDYQR